MIVRMLNQHLARPDADIRRVWIEAGHSVELGRNCFLSLYVDRCGERYVPKVEIIKTYRNQFRSLRLELDTGTWLDLIQICGLMAMPRAMELTREGGVHRVLMDFLKTDSRLEWAI